MSLILLQERLMEAKMKTTISSTGGLDRDLAFGNAEILAVIQENFEKTIYGLLD